MQIRNWAKRNPSLAPQYIAGPRPESQPESAPKRQYQMIEDAKRPGYFVQAPGAAQTPPAAPPSRTPYSHVSPNGKFGWDGKQWQPIGGQ